MFEVKSVADWAVWKNSAHLAHPKDGEELWLILRARTAAGYGSLEDQLIRLMVWVGATFYHGPKHTGIRDPLGMLRTREGWCDQQAKLFCFLTYHLFGVPGRTVSMKNFPSADGSKPAGHTVAEVFYNEQWHMFDVHKDHCTVYKDNNGVILSIAALRACPEVVERQPHWWGLASGHGKVGFYRSPIEPVATPLDYEKDCAWPWSVPPP